MRTKLPEDERRSDCRNTMYVKQAINKIADGVLREVGCAKAFFTKKNCIISEHTRKYNLICTKFKILTALCKDLLNRFSAQLNNTCIKKGLTLLRV